MSKIISKKKQNNTPKKKITKEALTKAIKGSYGIISTIAKRLKCERKTVYNKFEEWPELKDLLIEERNEIVDLAENKLVSKIKSGEKTSIHFILKTLGKNRGYVEKIQSENTNIDVDVSELSDYGLERLKRGDDPREVILDLKSRNIQKHE